MRRSLFLILAAILPAAACADAYAPQTGRAPLIEPASQSARQVVPITPPRSSRPSDQIEARLLAAHNAERALVGSRPLIWSEELEAEARGWAGQLISSGRFAHDPSMHGHGENLWSGWGGRAFTPEEMVGEWIAEKAQYREGVFPNVSRTGDWSDVGHYSQLVWGGTTHVGCAIVSRDDRSVLACRYAPPGNIDGRRAY
ncbi:MAG: CAP domain-containing protein [Brevundimonas sp.]|uniref:CAP domain-containing protein n=1 Tax=Brevundimonas sp. TaxID=1871086 RepID=UPI002489CA89|nr:CAP domain-containing protein [Brevundimonas sp.]MDI1325231.1 CAP domain-containing protein [Brevundimonas sp.]